MSKEKNTVELKDEELESVAGGQRGRFDVSAGWYKPDSSTYWYLANSHSGLDSKVSVVHYFYNSELNGLIRDRTAVSVYYSSLTSDMKVADENMPPIIQG